MKEYLNYNGFEENVAIKNSLKMQKLERNLELSDLDLRDKVQGKVGMDKKLTNTGPDLIGVSSANLAKQLVAIALCLQIQYTTLKIIRNRMLEMPEANYMQAVPLCIGAITLALMSTCYILKRCDELTDSRAMFRVAAFVTLCSLPGILAFVQSDGCEQPPPCFLLLSMGIVISMTGISVESDLSVKIGTAVSPAFALLLLYGVWVGITVRYVIWITLLSMTTAALMHDQLKAVAYGHDPRLSDLSPLIMFFIAINMTMYLMGWLVTTE
ncbi:hypothetical protein TTRE_0000235701 [Trichuris trichiura]|uniref:Uncharacterized protein n=1 Tax=Trichuris trichiura TaxID=36087 RepID=A0A077Z330_TRITR|nr:hypothetical protein TTRE_0000235701 [Trichuris trichiura]